MDRVKVYRRAAELVRRGWCKFYRAKDDNNKVTFYCSPEATQFCMTGALLRASDELGVVAGKLKFADFDIEGSLSKWNDVEDRTQGEVVDMLISAAEKAAKEGKAYG